eukprot:gene10890-12885_t
MNKPRPMKGWDATDSQTLMLDSEHTNEILRGHPLQPAVKRVTDGLAILTRSMTKPELSEQDIQQYRTISEVSEKSQEIDPHVGGSNSDPRGEYRVKTVVEYK